MAIKVRKFGSSGHINAFYCGLGTPIRFIWQILVTLYDLYF